MFSSIKREAALASQKPVAIFTWNPDWSAIKSLSLGQKIELFRAFVVHCQKEFAESKAENAVCLMVAPDLIFSLGSNTNINTYQDYLNFCESMRKIQTMLGQDSLLIASAINYITEDGNHYKITAPVITKERIDYYDKKATTGNRMHEGVSLPMLPGQTDGYFEFQGIPIGLEICQDHEKKTLQASLNLLQKTVAIHVLISYGQTRRDFAIAKPSRSGEVIFVHVELVAGAKNQESRTLETANYRVTLAPQKGSQSSDRTRHNILRQIATPLKLERINTSAIVSDDVSLASIRCCAVMLSPQKKLLSHRSSSESFSSLPLGIPVLQKNWSSGSSVDGSINTPSHASHPSQSVDSPSHVLGSSWLDVDSPSHFSRPPRLNVDSPSQRSRDSELEVKCEDFSQTSRDSESEAEAKMPIDTSRASRPAVGPVSHLTYGPSSSQNRYRFSCNQKLLKINPSAPTAYWDVSFEIINDYFQINSPPHRRGKK